MKSCPKCGKELKDTAKFCGGCGSPQPEAAPSSPTGAQCPQCGKELKPGAKFCGGCGAKVGGSAPAPAQQQSVQPDGNQLERMGSSGFIRWSMLPGQIAVRIGEDEIEACGKVKGIAIQDGTKALFFVNGKMVAELEAGSYAFKDLSSAATPETAPVAKRAGGFWGFLQGACEAAGRVVGRIAQAVGRLASGEQPAISVVLVRATEFPLVFTVSNANTDGVRSEVGLHVLCGVANINEFYRNLLLDRRFVCFEELQQALNVVVQTQINLAVAGTTPDKVGNNPALEQTVFSRLQPAIEGIYPFVAVKKILQLTADNQAIESLRQMTEELYISEKELAHLQKRNDFLNRLQGIKNDQSLAEGDIANSLEFRQLQQEHGHDAAMTGENQAQELLMQRRETEFEAGKLKIYQDMELTDDERAKFDMMLAAQRQIREAKNDDEIAAALLEFEKSGLFRDEEMDNIRAQISQRAQIRELNDAQALSVLTMQNEHALEMQKLDWEILIGDKKLEDEFARRRKIDAFNYERSDIEEARADARRDKEEAHADARRDKEEAHADARREADAAFADSRRQADASFEDSRRNADASFQDSRRQADIDFEKQERDQQMEMLRQAQALRMERENDEHRRTMEASDAAHRQKLEAENAARAHEEAMQKQQLDAKIENQRIYAGMSFEQIMAANPDISPEAAQALAKKFEAEAAAAQNDKTEELMRQQNAQAAELMRQQVEQANQSKGEMMAFMQQMMAQQNAVNLKQMEMMRDQTASFAARGAEELERTRQDANRQQDRMLSGVQATLSTAGTVFAAHPPAEASAPAAAEPDRPRRSSASRRPEPEPSPASASKSVPPAARKCPSCGAELEDGASFCMECGSPF